jgi:prefoldin subunit 5
MAEENKVNTNEQTKPDDITGQEGQEPTGQTDPQVKTEKFYTQEEVSALLGKVRSEEKQKLYSRIENSQKALKEAEAKLSALQAKAETATPPTETPATNKGETEIGNSNDELTALKKQNETLQAQFNELKAAYGEDIRKFATTLKETRLESAKKEVLAKYGGEIIPELIIGETPEEIVSSGEAAHARYLEIIEQAKKSSQKFPPAEEGKPAPKGDTKVENAIKSIQDLSYAEFMEKRDKIFAEAFGS